jgi:hypothetical protein
MKLVFEHNIQDIPCKLVGLSPIFYSGTPGGILNFTRINFRKFMNLQQEPNKFMLIDDNKRIQYCAVTRIEEYQRMVYYEISPLRDISIPDYAVPIYIC